MLSIKLGLLTNITYACGGLLRKRTYPTTLTYDTEQKKWSRGQRLDMIYVPDTLSTKPYERVALLGARCLSSQRDYFRVELRRAEAHNSYLQNYMYHRTTLAWLLQLTKSLVGTEPFKSGLIFVLDVKARLTTQRTILYILLP